MEAYQRISVLIYLGSVGIAGFLPLLTNSSCEPDLSSLFSSWLSPSFVFMVSCCSSLGYLYCDRLCSLSGAWPQLNLCYCPACYSFISSQAAQSLFSFDYSALILKSNDIIASLCARASALTDPYLSYARTHEKQYCARAQKLLHSAVKWATWLTRINLTYWL